MNPSVYLSHRNCELFAQVNKGNEIMKVAQSIQYQTNQARLSPRGFVSVLYGTDAFVTYENGKIVKSGSRSTK